MHGTPQWIFQTRQVCAQLQHLCVLVIGLEILLGLLPGLLEEHEPAAAGLNTSHPFDLR